MALEPGVTALVPTYNRGHYLADALSSLLGQTQPPVEIIVIDDGSTDDTAEVAASFGSQIVYIRKPNEGKSAALNTGLAHSTQDLIYILDDDDIAADDALERLTETLLEHPECGFVYAGYDAFTVSDTGTISYEPRAAQPEDDEELVLALMHGNRLRQQSMLVRRSCYDHVGSFNTGFIRSQDYEMLLRLARVFPGKKLDRIVCHLRQHGGIRGSAAMPIAERQSTAAWSHFDARVVAAVCESYSLHEFLPRVALPLNRHALDSQSLSDRDKSLSDRDRITALLQRCVIAGRKRLWTIACDDLEEACALASHLGVDELTGRQEAILQTMFDETSDGLHDFAPAEHFRATLLRIPSPRLSRQVRAALCRPVRRQMRQTSHENPVRRSVYLMACALSVSPSAWGIKPFLGNLALKTIQLARLLRENVLRENMQPWDVVLH